MKTMKTCTIVAAAAAGLALGVATAHAQSGTISKAVGGYSFEDAAKEAPTTKKNGKPLTFAIVTHTAGNGFFDPAYVGAKVAADAFGIKLIMLGSEAPVDDIPREIEILNQIAKDPTIDGVIMTTPQVGAYNDIVKKLESRGILVATMNSYDPHALRPQQHQPHRPGCLGGGDRRRRAGRLPRQAQHQGRLDPVPEPDRRRQCRGQQPRHRRLPRGGEGPEGRRPAAGLQGRCRAGQHRHRHRHEQPRQRHRDADRKPQGRGRAVRRQRRGHAGDRRCRRQLKLNGKVCAYGFDLGPQQREQIKTGALTGALGQQPFLQGF